MYKSTLVRLKTVYLKIYLLEVIISGIIFESAFLNMSHAATDYLISPWFYNNPWIRGIANKALEHENIFFNTDKKYIICFRFLFNFLYAF